MTDAPQTTPPLPNNDCCGWPETGVCPNCPDPETVAWGKAHPPCPAITPAGHSVFLHAGSRPPNTAYLLAIDDAIARGKHGR